MVFSKLWVSQNQVSHNGITELCRFLLTGNGVGLSYMASLFIKVSISGGGVVDFVGLDLLEFLVAIEKEENNINC